EISLTGHISDRLEISTFSIVRPLLLCLGVGLPSDDEVQRIGAHVAPGLRGIIQQTPRVGGSHREVVVADNELVIPMGGAKWHPPVRLPSTDDWHSTRFRPRREPAISHGEELPAEV